MKEDLILNNILKIAQADDRIRLVAIGGSRTNPKIEPDSLQDYDIVYGVTDLGSFLKNPDWIDIFGERIFLQTPDDMEAFPPDLQGKYAYLMLFRAGHRIDLTLVSLDQVKDYLASDSLHVILLDKDQRIPDLPPASDKSHHLKPPKEQEFNHACNEFWWVTTYVMKGIHRQQFLYAVDHLNEIIRPELIKMMAWWVGIETDFQLGLGKSHHQLGQYINPNDWHGLLSTYQVHTLDHVAKALERCMDLYRKYSKQVAEKMNFTYPDYDEKISSYIEEHFYDQK